MIHLPNNSILQVYDLFDPLPDFILDADTIFTDIPYNQSLLTNFSNRPGVKLSHANTRKFTDFTVRFFECVSEVAPETLFIETGKEALSDYIIAARLRFRYVTFYNATYYRKVENKSYIIHATQNPKSRQYKNLEDMDEEDIIAWICANHPYTCIGDLCMGKGLVGRYAYLAGRRFVGIDINPARLQVLVDFITHSARSNNDD